MLYITAFIYGKQKIKGEFKAYESKTLSIFKKYGGEIVTAYAPVNNGNQEDFPDEIHILKIANKENFDKFLNDPERINLLDERNQVISKTVVYLSDELIAY